MINNEDYISLKRQNLTNRFRVHSKNPFFHSEVIFKVYEDKIVFKKPTIDYSGRFIKPTKVRKTEPWVTFSIYNDQLIEGKLIISEESNEDELIFYYKDVQL